MTLIRRLNEGSSVITLFFSSSFVDDGILIATDAGGKEHFKVFIPKHTMRKEIDIAELSSGIYFLTLVTETGSVTRKFVKQ